MFKLLRKLNAWRARRRAEKLGRRWRSENGHGFRQIRRF